MVAGGMLPTFDDDVDAMYTTSSTMSSPNKRGSNLANIELQATAHRKGDATPAPPIGEEPAHPPSLIYLMSLLSAMGGFLFGYDTGIVSGAMVFVRKYFELNSVWQEVIVSITVLGAWILSILAGSLSERYGRKVIILLASVIFTFGSIVMGFAWSKWILLFGRLTVGVAIGLASTVVPIYIAEVAPSNIRGSLVTLNNCFITFGQLVAAITAGVFSTDHETGWRWMLSLAAVPAAIQFTGFMFMPESPRWLIRRRRDSEAMESLKRMRGPKSTRLLYEFDIIKQSSLEAENQKARRKQQKRNMVMAILRKTASRRALIVGCLLMSIQQLAGINTVMYYTATIIEMSGVQSQSMAVWLVVPTAFVYVIFSFAGYMLADRIGRRTLTLGSLMGVIIALLVLGTGFHLTSLDSAPVTVFSVGFNNSMCDKYQDCSSCIENPHCGFCYNPRDMSSTCLLRNYDDPGHSLYGLCAADTVTTSQPTQSLLSHNNNNNSTSENLNDNDNHYHHHNHRNNNNDDNLDEDNSLEEPKESYLFANQVCPQTGNGGIGLNTWLVVGGLVLYLAAFAPGMGPMPWTINSEIYPTWSRSFCYSMATSVNWLFNMIVSFTFLTLTEALTTHGTFYMYSIISSIGWILLFWKLPETRGRSLEEVSSLFARQKPDNEDIIDADNNSASSAHTNATATTPSPHPPPQSLPPPTLSPPPPSAPTQLQQQLTAKKQRTAWLQPTSVSRRLDHRASTGQLSEIRPDEHLPPVGHENLAYDSTNDDDEPDDVSATDHDVANGANFRQPVGNTRAVQQQQIMMNNERRRYSHNPSATRHLQRAEQQRQNLDTSNHYYLPPPFTPNTSSSNVVSLQQPQQQHGQRTTHTNVTNTSGADHLSPTDH
ncbi:Proton myo-inositol cotransporter, partial [Fragariocoptes setiger]